MNVTFGECAFSRLKGGFGRGREQRRLAVRPSTGRVYKEIAYKGAHEHAATRKGNRARKKRGLETREMEVNHSKVHIGSLKETR